MFGFVLGLVTSVGIARALGPEGNGVYVTFSTTTAFVVLISSMGVANYPAYAIARKKQSEQAVFAGIMYSPIFFVTQVFLASIVFVCIGTIKWGYLPLFIVAIFSGILFQSCLGFLQGKGDVAGYNISMLVSPLILAVFGFFALFVNDVELVLVGFSLGELIAALVVGVWAFKLCKPGAVNLRFNFLLDYIKVALLYGIKSQVVLLITFLMYRSVILMLASRNSPAMVGVLGLAISLAEKSWFVSQVVAVTLFKEMASETFSVKRLHRVAMWVGVATLLSAIFIILVVNFFGAHFGPGYSEVLGYMLILVPGVVTFASARIYVNSLLLHGISVGLLAVLLVMALVVLCISYAMVSIFGVTGGAVAISLGYFLYFVTIYWMVGEKDGKG